MKTNPNSAQPFELFSRRVSLTSVETFHALAGTKAFPNVVVTRCEFEGNFDPALAKQAWENVMNRQNMLVWNMSETGGGWFFLNPESEPDVRGFVDQTFSAMEVNEWVDEPLDRSMPGLNDHGIPSIEAGEHGIRLFCTYCESANRAELIFSAHHALIDGLAGVSIVRQWMISYDNLVHQKLVSTGLPRIDYERWKHRNHLGMLSWDYLKFLPHQAIGLFGATKFVIRKFCVFEAAKPVGESVASPGIVGTSIDAAVVGRLRETCVAHEVSENAMVIALLFRVLERLRQRKPSPTGSSASALSASASPWHRMILPMNIRDYADRRIPCTNKTSLVQLDRKNCVDVGSVEMAKTIHREISIISNWKLDRIFLIVLRLASVFPFLLRKISTNQKPRGTAVFANLGEPFKPNRHADFVNVGNLKRTRFDFSGPIREGTPINFTWQKYRDADGEVAGRLTLHFDPQIVSRRDAQWVLDCFLSEIQSET